MEGRRPCGGEFGKTMVRIWQATELNSAGEGGRSAIDEICGNRATGIWGREMEREDSAEGKGKGREVSSLRDGVGDATGRGRG